MTIFETLTAKCLPLIEAYHDDLLVHDRAALDKGEAPCTPFVHWTRQCGTSLLRMVPASEYPEADKRVPYLFGSADRYHILDQCNAVAKYWLNREPVRAVHYYDGAELHEITTEKAVRIVARYVEDIANGWKREIRERDEREALAQRRIRAALERRSL